MTTFAKATEDGETDAEFEKLVQVKWEMRAEIARQALGNIMERFQKVAVVVEFQRGRELDQSAELGFQEGSLVSEIGQLFGIKTYYGQMVGMEVKRWNGPGYDIVLCKL
jgi:hypothetical protein